PVRPHSSPSPAEIERHSKQLQPPSAEAAADQEEDLPAVVAVVPLEAVALAEVATGKVAAPKVHPAQRNSTVSKSNSSSAIKKLASTSTATPRSRPHATRNATRNARTEKTDRGRY
ncbi:MAG: hypothetical protein ACI9UA_005850, partial [Pseudoalteromonas tetraodonis]